MEKQNIFIILGILVLFLLQIPVQNIIKNQPEYEEIERVNPFEVIPPIDYLAQYLGATLLGGFRPLIVDYLWVKTSELQRNKQYEEIRTLLELIAMLQPRLKEVWTFNSWNMAYNISHQQETPSEKWHWVREGIDFASQGLETNLDSYDICEWIGYIYYNRVPQDPYFMEQVIKEKDEDTYAVASRWFAESIKKRSEQNEYPFTYESMYIAARYYHAFELLKKEKFGEVAEEWKYLSDYVDKTINIYHYDVARLRNEQSGFQELARIFELERKLNRHREKNGRDQDFFSLLINIVNRYKDIIHKKYNLNFGPINQRIEVLMVEHVTQIYSLIDRNEFDKAKIAVFDLKQISRFLIPPDPRSPVRYFYDGLTERFDLLEQIVKHECLFQDAHQKKDRLRALEYLKQTLALSTDYFDKKSNRYFDLDVEFARHQYYKKILIVLEK